MIQFIVIEIVESGQVCTVCLLVYVYNLGLFVCDELDTSLALDVCICTLTDMARCVTRNSEMRSSVEF